MFKYKNVIIEALGHASVKIMGSKTVYIDPYDITDDPHDADIILITHSHYDHLSPDDIQKVANDTTKIIATEDCIGKLKDANPIIPGENIEINSLTITAVPAYNINKKFHPKINNWVGYIVEIDDIQVYHAGDTDKIPEMKDISVDVAILPVGGTYTMNAEEAASAVNEDIRCNTAIPIHYGKIVGTEDDAERFSKLCRCSVKILY